MNILNRNRSSRSLAAAFGVATLLAAAAASAASSPLSMVQPQPQPTARLAVVSPSAQPAVKPAELPVTQAAADPALEAVGAGDMLHITVFRNPELTTDAKVTEQGTILFPLIGDVKVTGLSPQQVGSRISEMLRQGKYVVNPEVAVSLAQVNSRQVSVLGNVQKPGRYPLDSTTARVTDLLALAGGISPTGDDRITVMSTSAGSSRYVGLKLPLIAVGNSVMYVSVSTRSLSSLAPSAAASFSIL